MNSTSSAMAPPSLPVHSYTGNKSMDEVPAAARTLMMLSTDASRGRAGEMATNHHNIPAHAQTHSQATSRPYKFVPKREDDRILIAAFRYAVASARDRGLTNEHIATQIGESGMSANLISKVVCICASAIKIP